MSRVRLPFGKHKGCTVEQLPTSYLRWLSNQRNTDLEYWATLAAAEITNRQESEDLEAMADDFLRQWGIEPEHL